MIVVTIWLVIKSSPTRKRQNDLRTEFVVKVRTANMAQSGVLVTPNEEFATRFNDAVLAAAGWGRRLGCVRDAYPSPFATASSMHHGRRCQPLGYGR
jgi:hypothetical protein